MPIRCPRQQEIQDDHVRTQLQVEASGAAGGPGLADHRQVRRALDQAAERPPDPDVVIDDQDPELERLQRIAGHGLLHIGSFFNGDLVAHPSTVRQRARGSLGQTTRLRCDR